MAGAGPDALGVALMDALGLTGLPVSKLTITCPAGKVPTLDVELLLYRLDDTGENVLTEIRRYELAERSPRPMEPTVCLLDHVCGPECPPRPAERT